MVRVPTLLTEGEPPEPLDREYTIVGKSVDRIDGWEKATGQAKYAGDISLPGMLHAKILRCPHPHARILNVDLSKAQKVNGVKLILTKDNTKGWKTYWSNIPQPGFPEVISCAGTEIAVVAADSIDACDEAIRLISIDMKYQVLRPILDVEEALKPGALRVLPLDIVDQLPDVPSETPGATEEPCGLPNVYLGKKFVFSRGDVERGFREADVVLEENYSTPFQAHATLETRACVATWDGDKLTVWDTTQSIWRGRRQLAKSLGIAPEKVRVIVKFQGGGFGAKGGVTRTTFYAAKLAIMTNRPVKIVLNRSDEFLAHPRRHSAKIHLKVGAKKDGTLTALEGRAIIDVGAGTLYKVFTSELIWVPFNHYRCPHVRLEQLGVYTNNQLTGSMRGVLVVAGTFALESHIDTLAAKLGLDPLELRLMNYSKYGNQARKLPYSAKNLDLCLKKVTEEIGWRRKSELDRVNSQSPVKRGIGLAAYIYYGGVGLEPFEAKADVVIHRDSSVELRIGIVDLTGVTTGLSMIAAEELGVNMSNIKTVWGDTENTRDASPAIATRIFAEMGPAVLQASAQARAKIFEIASPLLGIDPQTIRSKSGLIYSKLDPSKVITFREVCEHIPEGQAVEGSGSRAPNPEDVVFAVFGAQAAETEVNTETGQVRVIKVASAHELGKAINPKLCFSQHYGGITQGIGYALLEEPSTDEKTGIPLNTDLHQYRIPTVLEIPEIAPFNIEAEDHYFAYSAKGIGECPFMPTAAAIRNSILHATGIYLNKLPITRDDILLNLKEKW